MKIFDFCTSMTHKTWCRITNIFWTTKIVLEDIMNENSFQLEEHYIYDLLDQNKFDEAELRIAKLSDIVGKYNHSIFKLNSQIRYKKIIRRNTI